MSRSVTSRALVRFTGPYTPIGEPSVRTQAYAVVDIGASLQLTRFGSALDVDLLNLLDTRYPELRASGFINPGAPFTLRAGVPASEIGSPHSPRGGTTMWYVLSLVLALVVTACDSDEAPRKRGIIRTPRPCSSTGWT